MVFVNLWLSSSGDCAIAVSEFQISDWSLAPGGVHHGLVGSTFAKEIFLKMSTNYERFSPTTRHSPIGHCKQFFWAQLRWLYIIWDAHLAWRFFARIKFKQSILPDQTALALQSKGVPTRCRCCWSYMESRWVPKIDNMDMKNLGLSLAITSKPLYWPCWNASLSNLN